MTPDDLAKLIKAVPIQLTGVAAIDRAISTAGGVSFTELDGAFMLKARPGTALDWLATRPGADL